MSKYQFSVDYIFIMHFTTASSKTYKRSHMFHKKQTKKNAIVPANQNKLKKNALPPFDIQNSHTTPEHHKTEYLVWHTHFKYIQQIILY